MRGEGMGLRGLTMTLTAAVMAGAQALAGAVSEAPMLAERVAKGELPPVAERVGAEPLVLKPHASTGRYGGVMRTALRGGGDHNAILRMVGAQGLVRWNLDMTDVLPNVAQAWEVSEDATTYTFRLREGMKWSDGTPFTAADVLFAANDLLLNPEFTPSTPGRYASGGKPMTVEALDATTVRVTFAEPYGRFLPELATPLGQHLTLYQKGYCSQFHPAHAGAEAVAALVAAGGHKDWPELMRARCADIEIPARWNNPARPTLDPWVIVDGYGGGVTRVTMTRNPYFWQVDDAGQQLPYIDRLEFPVISDVETILLTAISGGLDLQMRHITAVANRPVLAENAARGGYEFVGLSPTSAAGSALWFNLTVKDDVKRAIFNDRRFRVAISHGIDRAEIIEAITLGQSEPYQVGPVPAHPLHNKQLSYQHLEHDAATANALLDEMGLTGRDGEGFRLMPDGKRLSILAEFPVSNPNFGDTLELIKRDLQEIGVDVQISGIERALFYDRAAKNDHEVHISIVPGGLNPFEELRAIVAEHPIDSRQSLEWQKWYVSGGREGIEPSESMKKRMRLLDQWRATADRTKADAIFAEILQEAADAFEIVGINSSGGSAGIRNARLRNVPDPMISAWTFATPGGAAPQQFYYE